MFFFYVIPRARQFQRLFCLKQLVMSAREIHDRPTMIRLLPFLLLQLLGLLVVSDSHAADPARTWKLAADFSQEKNPNGPWTYGFTSYGRAAITPLPAAKAVAGIDGLDGWAGSGGKPPFIAKNTTAHELEGGGFTVEADQVAVAPGSNQPTASDVANVRWTAPEAGDYEVAAEWRRLHPEASAFAFVIRQQGLPEQEIVFPGQPVPPSGGLVYAVPALSLEAGETLDFPVWAGHEGAENDVVGLSITISRKPGVTRAPAKLLDYPLSVDTKDLSGRGLPATVHGSPQPVKDADRSAMRFGGAGDWIDTGTNLAELKKEFTIEAWVKPEPVQPVNADIFGNHTNDGKGLLLQQDGSNVNRFAFLMGNGAGHWTFTKPIQFTPDVWQHVAVVKSAREIRFYLNGILLDTVPAAHGYAVSPMNFAIGLGFEDASRCFRGEIAGLQVWDKALPEIKPKVTAQQQFRAQATNSGVRLDTVGSTRIFPATKTPAIQVRYEAVGQPPAGAEIRAAFECSDYDGKKFAIPPVELTSKNQFAAQFGVAVPAGFYRLTCQPSASGPDGRIVLPPVSLSFSVLGGAAKEAPAARRPAESPLGSKPTVVTSLDGADWLIATDPKNVGREQGWFNEPAEDAKPTKVPWIIQDIFNNYHGVAWYWRDFTAPPNADPDGRTILRFLGVDYLAEVWLNGQRIGSHEGAEDPFEFDVTSAIKPNGKNRLAVRVLNPTNEPIDGIALNTTARGPRAYPVQPGSVYNTGGITDSVQMLATPVVRIEDVYLKPDWKTGRVRIEANMRNAGKNPVKATARFAIAPAKEGKPADSAQMDIELPPGDTKVEADLAVADWRLWSLEDPAMYQVTSEVGARGSKFFDERRTRTGFRDFRYENNAFRLNGKRILLQGALILPHFPIGFRLPPDEKMMRQDVEAAKKLGLNIIRVIWGGLRARDMDIFDDLGVLVLQEHFGGIQITPSPDLTRRFEASLAGMVRRDRNHPSIAMWGVMNEMWDGPQFRHGVASLPLIKFLDDTRPYFLNSGGFDMQMSIGSISNPGATEWQHLMGSERPDGPNLRYPEEYGVMQANAGDIKADIHAYQSVPHTAAEIERMRTIGKHALDGRKIMVTEIGTGSAINLPVFLAHYKKWDALGSDDAVFFQDKFDQFLADWKAWNLDQVWERPEDYFINSEANMLKLRRETGNALRANPFLAGYLFCALTDSDFDGVGLLNLFREFKPGVIELQADLTAPLRWSLFAEPVNISRNGTVNLEAVLSDLDALKPGDYPVKVEVLAPDGKPVFEESLTVNVPDPAVAGEPPFVRSVFKKDVPISGPAGTYQFRMTFAGKIAATGGGIPFRVFDPAEMPKVAGEVVLWGSDPDLAQWLADHGIRTRAYAPGDATKRELILVGTGGGDLAAFQDLARRMATGSTVVFLSPGVFPRDAKPLGWLPLAKKGTYGPVDFYGGYYRGDTFGTGHALFDGLPGKGVLDYTLYRNILNQGGYGLIDAAIPDELIVGGIRAQFSYESNVQTAAYSFGAGRFLFNTLKIRDSLGKDPVAELLLRNLLNYAARGLDKPPADLPADFDQQLKAIGYE